jgi:hypothetical protein
MPGKPLTWLEARNRQGPSASAAAMTARGKGAGASSLGEREEAA